MAVPSKQTANYVETKVDDEILIVDLDGGALLSLTGTAAAIWDLIDGERDRSQIVAEMVERFAGDAAAIAADVEDFLQQLHNEGLIAVSAPKPAL